MEASQLDIKERARRAVALSDWSQVNACAMEIARREPGSPDAPFLLGLSQKAAQKPDVAAEYFRKALTLQPDRYDVAVELASQYVVINRYVEARDLLRRYGAEHPADLPASA